MVIDQIFKMIDLIREKVNNKLNYNLFLEKKKSR